MNYAPLNYQNINLAAGRFSPSTIKAHNNLSFWFWSRSLFQRMASVIDFTVPENWEGKTKDFFVYCLFKYGFVAIFYDDKYGLSFQPAAPKGYDFYYQPTGVLVSNPLLNKEFTIGVDAELLKLTQFSSVQSLNRVRLFETPLTAARQASLSITNSWSLPKLMSIESVMPSNHLVLCHPLLLLPSVLPSIRVFSSESVLHIRWPKCWSFSISPSNEYSGLISFMRDWFNLFAV